MAKALVRNGIADSLIDFIAQDHACNELAPGHLSMLGSSKNGKQNIAWMAGSFGREVVEVVHFREARSGAINKGSQVRGCFHARADNARTFRIRHQGCDIAGDTARFSRKASHQSTECVYDA